MSLKNIKSNSQAKSGFTIVELLIVVVVIAILAAITIVSYNGITSRANASSAQATAASLQKKVELYAADGPTSQYPKTIADLSSTAVPNVTSKSYYLPTTGSVNVTANAGANPTSSNGTNTVRYQGCGVFSSGLSSANLTTVNGAIISWYDFQNNGAIKTVLVGDTSGSCATS
jgi:prepilin-type N-terminal cleavage/methylation domain-containing protein